MTSSDTPPAPAEQAAAGKGLAAGKLGLWSSTIIGLSSTAPLYSLAATLGFVVMAVGAQAPIVFIVAFIPMLLTAFAYRELNDEVPDAGTAFTWATKAFGPVVGWMSGWGIVVAGVIIMANQTEVAARYLWLVIGGDELASSKPLVTATGAVFIILMTAITYRNVHTGARTQDLLIGIQYVAMAAFIVGLLLAIANGDAADYTPFSWEWFNPLAAPDLQGFVQAVLITIFIYWGWDTCLSLSEETKNPRKTPGRAALLSSTILLVTYVALTVVAMMYAGVGEEGTGLANPEMADDVFFGLREGALGGWGWLIVLAVSVSALATCQTTILPTARSTFAMAVYKALPSSFAKVSSKHQTPSVSTIGMGAASLAFYLIMTLTSESMLADTVEATSLAVAGYYATTSFATIWYFRSSLFASARNIAFRLVLPLIGGVLMTGIIGYSVIAMADPEYGETELFGVSGVLVTMIVALLIGIAAMLAWGTRSAAKDFFEGRSLNRETPVLVPE